MTATDKPDQDRDDSIAYWILAVVGGVFAVLLGRELYLHDVPPGVALFAMLSSFTGTYMSLGHLWAGWQRAKTVTSDSD